MKHIKLIWHKSILGSVDYNNMQRFSFTDRKSERAIIKQRDWDAGTETEGGDIWATTIRELTLHISA